MSNDTPESLEPIREVIELSPTAQKKFAELLLNPAQPSKQLLRAFACHRQLIREIR